MNSGESILSKLELIKKALNVDSIEEFNIFLEDLIKKHRVKS